MAKNQKPQPEGWRTTRTERINYYIGDIGRSLEGYIVTAMMTLFLLFQGIDLIKVSAAILAVKIIDAFDDIIFGFFIDKLDIKKSKLLGKLAGEGKYLPWYRATFFLFPIFTVIFFLMPQNAPEAVKLIWFTDEHDAGAQNQQEVAAERFRHRAKRLYPIHNRGPGRESDCGFLFHDRRKRQRDGGLSYTCGSGPAGMHLRERAFGDGLRERASGTGFRERAFGNDAGDRLSEALRRKPPCRTYSVRRKGILPNFEIYLPLQ